MGKKKYKEWTLIEWDGNTELGYKCWRKSFRNGHVSVGCGEFKTVVYSYGANSDYSCSSTRWNYDDDPITEKDMMEFVDMCRGYDSSIAIRMYPEVKKPYEKIYSGNPLHKENFNKTI